jgi:hypothetical protein
MKVYQRATFALGLAALLVSLNMTSSLAVDGQPFGPILGGLKGVYLQVEVVASTTEMKGISTAQLRRKIERQLTKAGITLLSERQFNNFRLTGSYPLARLDIGVSADEVEVAGSSLNVNFIDVRALQQALLGRKPSIRFFATTWRRQEINYSNDPAEVHEVLKEIVHEFISAYKSANR